MNMEHERNTVELLERSAHARWFWPLLEIVACVGLLAGTLSIIGAWL